MVGHHDEHQRRRNDLCQRAGRRDDPGSHPAIVAVAQHDRQRDQPHGYHRGCDHAGRRGQQRPDEDHGISQAAAHRSEQLPDGVEQILRHAGSFEDQAHEGEKRNGQQGVIVHHPVKPLGQRLQEVRLKLVGDLDADEREDQPVRGERERDRVTEQQEDHQRHEHQRRHILGQKFHQHVRAPNLGCPRSADLLWLQCGEHTFGFFLCGVMAAARCGIGELPSHDGDAFDQFGDALEEQQNEPDEQQ